MKKLLWVGDAGVHSGFARATHEILDTLHYAYQVTVLAMNYRGDPHKYPYEMWAAAAGGDSLGVGRLIWMCDLVKPDVIIIQCDGWHVQDFMERLHRKKLNGEYVHPEYAAIPVIAIVAIDGKNFQGEWLEGVTHTIFWTQFALNEAREGRYKGPATVIPLGVDRTKYFPADKKEARKVMPEPTRKGFFVGNINRNQSRKRWDLTVKYFAEFVYKGIPREQRTKENRVVKDAWLFMHAAPTGDSTINILQLTQYYGVFDLLVWSQPQAFYGASEAELANIYNCLDVLISTSQGEGFGLPALEAMACRVACILPDNSAYGEWAKRGAWLVPCTSTIIGEPYVNVIGGVPDEARFVQALQAMYANKTALETNATAALECASQECFSWEAIGASYLSLIDSILYPAIGEAPVVLPSNQVEGEWLRV